MAKECILSTTTAVCVVFIGDKRQSTIVTVLMKELRLFAEYLYLYIFSHVQASNERLLSYIVHTVILICHLKNA